jgi:transcriptional regulator with XRE-family HTH domain
MEFVVGGQERLTTTQPPVEMLISAISTAGSCFWRAKFDTMNPERRIPMNQEKIGKFIAACRKEQGYTQAALAEQLGITDRAVSKWETGKSLPDASIMLSLCELLSINVNELLTGERLPMNHYQEMAEQNLLQLKQQEELHNKKLLSLEVVIGYLSTISFLVMILAAGLGGVESTVWKIVLIAVGAAILTVGCFFTLKLEHDVGYYECPHCKKRYIPTMRAVILAPHNFRSRWMKCPYCGKRGYHKKVLTK